MSIIDPQTAIYLRILSDILAFIEYMAIVIASAAVAVTAISAVAVTRPGTQALVGAVMACIRKDPPVAPSPAEQQCVQVTALKLQPGD